MRMDGSNHLQTIIAYLRNITTIVTWVMPPSDKLYIPCQRNRKGRNINYRKRYLKIYTADLLSYNICMHIKYKWRRHEDKQTLNKGIFSWLRKRKHHKQRKRRKIYKIYKWESPTKIKAYSYWFVWKYINNPILNFNINNKHDLQNYLTPLSQPPSTRYALWSTNITKSISLLQKG